MLISFFDAPSMCLVQSSNDQNDLRRVADLICKKMVEMANECERKAIEDKKPVKKGKGSLANRKIRQQSQVYARCHFVGDVLKVKSSQVMSRFNLFSVSVNPLSKLYIPRVNNWFIN